MAGTKLPIQGIVFARRRASQLFPAIISDISLLMVSDLFLSKLPECILPSSGVEQRLLAEYGSVFVAQNVRPPTRIVFENENDVIFFQSTLEIALETIGNFEIELQSSAMRDLLEAIEAAESIGKGISPRFADSARRNYRQTVELWASRVEPALEHWSALGRISNDVVSRIRSLSPFEQVSEVLELEEDGIYFAKDFSKSIIYSVAPPGTSQHLSLLAIDVAEFRDPQVCEILSKNKWFQTVVSDLPHFTYLGIEERELPSFGLKLVNDEGRRFWVPDVD
jgi:hypothetical protein